MFDTPRRVEYTKCPRSTPEEQRDNLAAWIAALRSGEFEQGLQVHNPDGIRKQTDTGRWSVGGVASEIWRRRTGRGFWDEGRFHEVVDLQKTPDRTWSSGYSSYDRSHNDQFFGSGDSVVIRWIDDGSGHPTPVWANLIEYEKSGATFAQIADALERTHLKSIPLSIEECEGIASRKGNKDVKSGLTPIGKKLLSEVSA